MIPILQVFQGLGVPNVMVLILLIALEITVLEWLQLVLMDRTFPINLELDMMLSVKLKLLMENYSSITPNSTISDKATLLSVNAQAM